MPISMAVHHYSLIQGPQKSLECRSLAMSVKEHGGYFWGDLRFFFDSFKNGFFAKFNITEEKSAQHHKNISDQNNITRITSHECQVSFFAFSKSDLNA